MRNGVKQYIELVVGVCLMSIAYKSIYEQAGMVTGGFSGIGVIVKELTSSWFEDGVPLWVTNIMLNIPLFTAAYILIGKNFVKKTLLGAVLLTVFLAIIPDIKYIEETDYLITAVFGGVLCGVGIGLVLLSGAATGGTDMLAVIIHKYLKRYSVVEIMQFLDGIIVLAGVAVFGLRVSLYAVIAIYITTLVSDSVLEGPKQARVAFIITDKYEVIADCIKINMDRGVTLFEGKGMYSYQPKKMLMCVVSKKEINTLKQICMTNDDKSFILISDVREVMGEGFVQNTQ